MSNVIPFKPRTRFSEARAAIIHKVVNGEIIECVDLDALSPQHRAQCFSRGKYGAPTWEQDDAPIA